MICIVSAEVEIAAAKLTRSIMTVLELDTYYFLVVLLTTSNCKCIHVRIILNAQRRRIHRTTPMPISSNKKNAVSYPIF